MSKYYFFWLFCLPSMLWAQKGADIRLNQFYEGSFDQVLDAISRDYGVEFEFDRERLKAYQVSVRLFNRPLTAFLEEYCRKFGLKYQLDADGRWSIQDRRNASNRVTTKNVRQAMAPRQFDFALSGRLIDESTGEALPFANLQVKGSTTGSTTNADGLFTLLGVPSDTATLIISYIGYQTVELQLSPDMPKKNLVIQLQADATQLEEVTIVGKRSGLIEGADQLNTVRLSPKTLELLPNIGDRDVMRSFQLMPGVSASNENSSGLFVRGGTPDQNLILYDGFTVYHVDHLYGFFSAFNANALKDVQLYKGGFESRFGGRLSSVTEITGKDGNANRFNLGGDISLLSMNVYGEMPVGDRFTSLVAYRRSWQGPVYNQIFDTFNEEPEEPANRPGGGRFSSNLQTEVASYFYDLNAKFTFRPSERDILSLSIYNGSDYLDNGRKVDLPSFLNGAGAANFNISDLTNYGNVGLGLRWSHRWSNKLMGNTLLSFSNYYSERDRTNEGTIRINDSTRNFRTGTIEDNDLRDFSIRSDFQWDAFIGHQIKFGFQGNYFDIDYRYAQNDTINILDRQDQGQLYAVYLQDDIRINSRLSLLPGLRASYFNETAGLYWEPRLSLRYQLREDISLQAAAGQYYQFANRVVREDILQGSRDFWVLSDGNTVPVSRSRDISAGIKYQPEGYLFSVEGYYKTLRDISEYSLRFQPSPEGLNYEENFFTGTGQAKGLEFLIQRSKGAFTGWVSYTLSEARNRFAVYSDTDYPANQDVTHEFKIAGILQLGRWNFSATWIYATGRPYTSPAGAYQLSLLDGSTQEFFTAGAKNSQRLPDYHRMDLAATYLFFRKDKSSFGNLGLSLFNLYDRTNVWYKEFEILEGEVIATDVNFLGFTPNLSLSLKLR